VADGVGQPSPADLTPPPRAGQPPAPVRVVMRRLAAAPTTPALVRRHVAAVLTAWGHTAALVDDVRTVASELTGNAVTACLAAAADPARRSGLLSMIGLRVTDTGRLLVVDVADAAPGQPTITPDDPLGEHGRGLRIVAALATWGTCANSDPVHLDDATTPVPGKTVWAAFTYDDPPDPPQDGPTDLPRRVTALAPPREQPETANLRRLLDGLRTLDLHPAPDPPRRGDLPHRIPGQPRRPASACAATDRRTGGRPTGRHP
jgi:hypothetical protein